MAHALCQVIIRYVFVGLPHIPINKSLESGTFAPFFGLQQILNQFGEYFCSRKIFRFDLYFDVTFTHFEFFRFASKILFVLVYFEDVWVRRMLKSVHVSGA